MPTTMIMLVDVVKFFVNYLCQLKSMYIGICMRPATKGDTLLPFTSSIGAGLILL